MSDTAKTPDTDTPPRGPLARFAALDPAVKLVLQMFALVGAIAGAVEVYNRVVTEGELVIFRRAQANVDTAQSAAIEAVDDDADLLFQTTVRLTTDVDWLKQEISGVRQDLRRMDRGQPLSPLPAPSPAPRPTVTP